jgi:dTDP-4-dehydrorhamnose reductase
MKIMITGSEGQLGKDLQQECQSRAIKYIASDLDVLDICDLKEVQHHVWMAHPTAIINCAAYNAVDQAESDFEKAKMVNGIGPKNLAIAAEEAGIPIIHFSTDFVFKGDKGSAYSISDKPEPISRYGQSKLLGEQQVQAVTNRFFIVRLSWVFGAGNMNFVKKVLEWAEKNDEIKIVDDQVSSPAYTVDLAPAILDLLETGSFGMYHLTNKGHCSRYEWAKLIVEKAGLDTKVLPAKSADFSEPAKRPEFSALDNFPIADLIGREMPTWQDATERFLQEIGAIK